MYYSYSSATTGTAEDWPMVLRVNDATDYAIGTVSAASNVRQWSNSFLNIPISAGDYVEIKTVTPDWVTAPAGTSAGGYILFESE
jgi:hypothetical protein